MATINAQTIINEVMAAYAVAPDKKDSDFFGKIKFQTSTRGFHSVQNSKENLANFADLVRKNAAAFGGGLVRIAKPRSVVTWPAKLVTVFKQAIEDKDYQAALDIGEQIGARFFVSNKGQALMQVAPVPFAFDDRLISVLNENGTYSVIDPISMCSVNGNSYTSKRTRMAQVESVLTRYSKASTEQKDAMFAKAYATPANQGTIRAQWMLEHGLDDQQAIDARIAEQQRIEQDQQAAREARREAQAAQDVANLVANATTAAAIEQASESAALSEIATTSTQAAPELATVEAVECVAITCEASNSAGSGQHHSTGHVSNTTSNPQAARGALGGNVQQVKSKNGTWHAAFFTDAAGSPCMAFGDGEAVSYESGRARMQALQAMASKADQQAAQRSTPAPEPINPRGFDVLTTTGEQVRSLGADNYAAIYDHLENINFHSECLMLECMRRGRDDLAGVIAHLVRYQQSPGCMGLGWDVCEARAIVASDLDGSPAKQASPEAGVWLKKWGYSPTNPAPEAQATPTPAGSDGPTTQTPASSQACGLDDENEGDAPEFSKMKPFNLDPRTLLAAGVEAGQLVGWGVHYTGNMANASGVGAITNVEDKRGERFGRLAITCTLEDGRVIHAEPHYFTEQLRPIFKFNSKMHGAPYLAQLAGAAATRKATTSAAIETAATARAAERVRLAAQYPQLLRAESKHQGGKLAAANIRTLLKESFKGQKFSVTSDYSTVRIGWTDGPTDDEVQAIIGRFDIGASDTQSDYFYTVDTAFSDLFGGVQYMFSTRHVSDDLVTSALADLYPEEATRPSVQDYRKSQGRFDWATDGHDGHSYRMRQHLAKISAYQAPAAKTGRKTAQA